MECYTVYFKKLIFPYQSMDLYVYISRPKIPQARSKGKPKWLKNQRAKRMTHKSNIRVFIVQPSIPAMHTNSPIWFVLYCNVEGFLYYTIYLLCKSILFLTHVIHTRHFTEEALVIKGHLGTTSHSGDRRQQHVFNPMAANFHLFQLRLGQLYQPYFDQMLLHCTTL